MARRPQPNRTTKPRRPPPGPISNRTEPPEVVDPRWVLKALALSLLAALVCGYAAVCFILYQGAWQLLLHPAKAVSQTPAALNLPFDPLRFDAAETGSPRLAAWWVPAQRPAAPTILLLHGANGALGETVPLIGLLHQAGANVFAFDYRGFGQSDPEHPSEQRMTEDTSAALDYLTTTRHLAPGTIVPYGVGLGASLAAKLAATHPELPAVVIDNPDPDAGERLMDAERSRFIPVSLLLRDRFDLRPTLAALKQPELLITGGPEDTAHEHDAANLAFFRSLPGRKLIVSLEEPGNPQPDAPSASQNLIDALDRFLDEYLVTPPAPQAAVPAAKQ